LARTLNEVLATLPVKRRVKIERRASVLATLKDLRQAVERTQQELAASLGVGQDTISRIERRGDMLLSTLRRYVEAMGGKLELVAEFPHRPRMVIDQLTPARQQSSYRAQAKSKHRTTSRPPNTAADRTPQTGPR
jgi:transcriptional regulator with XRE-family HTH domain